MKNIIKNSITIVAASFLLIACEKSPMLDKVPLSFTSPENYYKNINDFESALAGCYHAINMQFINNTSVVNGTYSSGLQFMLSAGTDEMVTQSSAGAQERDRFGIALYDADNNGIGALWMAYYAGVMRCNVLLEKAEQVHFNPGDTELLNVIVGEARFLRGFFYFHMAMLYGGIPINLSSEMEVNSPRSSVEEIFNQIILPDFRFAYENLTHRGSQSFKANKWTAGGYLATALNYLASCKSNNVNADLSFELNSFSWVDVSESYSESRRILMDIVNNSGYKLIERYDYLFRETTRQAQREECLLLAENSSVVKASYPDISFVFCPQGVRNTFGGSWGTQVPTVELYQSYNPNLDSRLKHNITGIYNATSQIETVEGGVYYIPTVSTAPNFWRNTTGKFRHVDPRTKTIPLWASGISVPLLRYADILLQYAETLYFTGDETTARNYLTQVRQRSIVSGASIDELNTSYFKADFVEELLDERKRELCFESKRRIDLIRFGKIESAIMGLNPEAGVPNTRVKDLQANWAPHKIWMPIPTREVRLNKKLIQNPGF